MAGRRAAAAAGAGGHDSCCLHDSEVGAACFPVKTPAGALCRSLAEELFGSERRLTVEELKGADDVGDYGWNEVAFDWGIVPLCLLVVVSLIWVCLGLLYTQIVSKSDANQSWVGMYIGNYNRTPQHPRFVAALEFIQTVLSLVVAILFVENTIALRETARMRLFHQCSSVFLSFHFLFRGLQNEFRLRSCFDIEAIVDIFTLPGLMYARHSWLSLSYLRTVSALAAYGRLERLVNLHLSLGPISHGLLHMFLEFLSLVMCFACAIFSLEVLGEAPGMAQSTFKTGMGDISVFRMVYWSIETLTTVGYGEFVPTTFLSRVLTMICMLGGLVFFAGQVNKMQEIMSSVKSGFLDFVPGNSKHVILMGASVFDSNLHGGLLEELYHPKHHMEWPDMVVLGIRPRDLEQFRSAVEDHFRNVLPIDSPLNRIHYIVGSPLIKKDLDRCHCNNASMVYIMSNTSITEKNAAEEEDKQTTLRTLSFKRHFPDIIYRVALLEVKSVERAHGADIPVNRVFAINMVRGAMLCECARCPGWSTMVEHFLTTCTPVLEHIPKGSWQYKYLQGRSTGISGFLAADEFCGRPTNELVKEAYRRGGACIMSRARPYDEGGRQMELMPASADELVTKQTIFWAMCSSSKQLNGVSKKVDPHDWKTNWEQVFSRQRKQVFSLDSARRGTVRRQLELKYNVRRSSIAEPSKGRSSPSVRPHAKGSDVITRAPSSDAIKQTQSSACHDFYSQFETCMEMRKLTIMDKFTDEGANFALLLDFSETWCEVLVFLRKSRESHLPAKIPVVVLSKTALSEKESELIEFVMEYEDIAIFEGNPEVEKDLVGCGVLDCCSIICVGNESKEENSFSDTDILLVYGLLTRLHLVDKTILLEFQDPEHMCLLPGGDPAGSGSGGKISDVHCTYTFDQHFVSGKVFLPRFVGTLIGGAARVKGLIELMQRLSMPTLPFLQSARDEDAEGGRPSGPSAVWQIRVPPALRGQKYGRLFNDLMDEDQPALTLGISRSFVEDGAQASARSGDGDMEAPLIDGGPLAPPSRTPPGGYVLTNPSEDEVVQADDIIFVLASQKGAEKWMGDGLLLNFGYTASPVKDTGSSAK